MTGNTGSLSTEDRSRQRLSPATVRLVTKARNEWKHRNLEAAERSLVSALALSQNEPTVLRMLGMVVQRRGDAVRAVDYLQQALPALPEDAELRIALGIALCECDKVDAGVAQLRHACELASAAVSPWFNLGKALQLGSHWQGAAEALCRALELDPSHLPSRLLLAKAQASLGDIDAAVAGFRDVLRRDPENAEAWFGLSSLNTIRFDAVDMACLQRAFARKHLSARQFELLGFTFAKALEYAGDYARAFDVFQRANASRRRRRAKWDAAAERHGVERILCAFAATQPVPLDTQLGQEVILLVSMPRAGSTLVEQILASHPQVEGANEIEDLTQVVDAETRRRGLAFPCWVSDATAEDWQRLGREYLSRTARWRKNRPRFTDKSLVNWKLVGVALAMLPGARVVVVRRDPVETCLGCYRQCFSEARGFTCDLNDTADYCIGFLRLTRFWLSKYPDRVFDLAYESLIADPGARVHQLLDFCGLPFDPICLEFHKTTRAVLSGPSAAQVRQPLRHDTARAACYGDKLDRLRERLAQDGVLTG